METTTITKAKRMTKEQKEAMAQYHRTICGYDNYLSSVFVSASQTAYYDRLIAERKSKCQQLGIAL